MAELGIFKSPTQLLESSLQETALLSTAVGLCNNYELLTLILNCDFKVNLHERTDIKIGQDYKKVEAKANELLSEMHGIGTFKAMIQDLLWPLTYRIIRWRYIYASAIDNQFLQCFYWTCQGKIDSKKTAKYIIKNKIIPIVKRFMLACSLCLKDEIKELLKEMPSCDRIALLQTEEEIIPRHLGYFWIWHVEENDAPTSLDSEINLAIVMKSIDATKYLFSLLPEDEKGNAAKRCAKNYLEYLKYRSFLEEEESDIGYYIFSQMTKTYQKIFFDSNVTVVSFFLLNSPGQNEFFEVLKDNLDAFSERVILSLISVICYKLHLSIFIFKDYDYFKLLLKVWGILSRSTKSFVIESKWLMYRFCFLISDYFRFLLTKIPSKSIKTKKYTNTISHNFDKWKLLLFFIEHEIVTAESLKENKERMLKILHIRKCNKPAWQRLLKFVNDKRVNKNGE